MYVVEMEVGPFTLMESGGAEIAQNQASWQEESSGRAIFLVGAAKPDLPSVVWRIREAHAFV
jgi:hypothetical protein